MNKSELRDTVNKMLKSTVVVWANPTTYLEPEHYAYPHGGQHRKGKALFADGTVRTVYAGIPDTFFSIPAHCRVKGKYVGGFLTRDRGEWHFHPAGRYWGICKRWEGESCTQ